LRTSRSPSSRPCSVYVRRDGAITETILDSDVLLDFRGEAQRKQLAEVLRPLLGAAVS
jgi:hypothetical protein